jgi:teichuronic acid biosynthesis glycosyltransferase TuaC
MTGSSPLRIVSVCRTLPSPDNPGAGIFVLRRLSAMAAAGDVQILQPVPFCHGIRPIPAWAREPEHNASGQRIRHQPMLYVPGVLKAMDGHWLARAVLPRLRAWHKQKPIDVVDAHFGYPDGVGCVYAARKLGVPAFITIRGSETDRVRERLIGGQLINAMNAAAGCISVSHTLRRLMIEHGADGDRITVIPNAVDRQIFRPGDRQAARAALGLPPSDPLVVSVGQLVSLKRHDVVIRALDRLRDRFSTLRVAIVGGTDYEPGHPAQLKQLVEELRLGDRVRFVGRIPPPQVADWLRAADVFALGSLREGCCNAVLEALASGTPAVVTPVGDNPQFVIEGENGYLVPVGDAEAMANAFAVSLGRQWDRDGVSASLRVGTWERTAREVLSFFADRIAARMPVAA